MCLISQSKTSIDVRAALIQDAFRITIAPCSSGPNLRVCFEPMKPLLALDQSVLEKRSLARNEVLFRQGDKVTAIYFIEAGRLHLERRTFDGRSLVLGTTSAGEFFVEVALFSDTYHCDAMATEPSQVCIYP